MVQEEGPLRVVQEEGLGGRMVRQKLRSAVIQDSMAINNTHIHL